MLVNQLETSIHACSIESCSEPGSFACGLYELNESTGSRTGSVSLYRDSGASNISIDMPSGVLDMKWCANSLSLACALSDESLCLLSRESPDSMNLHITENFHKPGYGLFLSLDRSDHFISNGTESKDIIVSTQSGSILTFSMTPSGLQHNLSIENAHKLFSQPVPAWIVTVNTFNKNIIMSGGDDSVIKWWDLRCISNFISQSKHHMSGVTSAQYHPYIEHILATGSYDENIFLWDDRNLSIPIEKIPTGNNYNLL